MRLDRRQFIKFGLAAGTALALEDQLGLLARAMELETAGRSVSRLTGKERMAVPYTCLVCNIEDGGLAFIEDGRVVKLEGNPRHPSTRGRLCAKVNSGLNDIYDPDRILYPLKRVGARGSGQWKRVSWDEALTEVAFKIRAVIERADQGKGSRNEIVFHWGRNRTGNFCNRFMHSLGSNAILNHTSICESSKKAGMEVTWGPDIETPDFENTKYILNFGSNIFEAAYFMNPYAQRLIDGIVSNRAKLVTFDVRLSNTAAKSHEWFPVFPGTDGIVALAMANVIMQEGLYDRDFIKDWTNVLPEDLAEYLKQFTPEMAERYSGVPAKDIRRIAIEFGSVRPATTYTYRGPSMHLYGSYNERCTMLLSIITGNIEAKGGYCLPRGMGWPQPKPVPPPGKEPSILANPPEYPLAHHKVSHHVPFMIKEGRAKVSVYFSYYVNPAYTFPSSAFWRALYLD